METNLYEVLIKAATEGKQFQHSDGKFEKGHNGPWNDNDTYVRTTAHWAILMYKVYEMNKEISFLESANRACRYLLSEEARPRDKTFYCRNEGGNKNKCNGLIGQAWAVEPLIEIGKGTENEKYLMEAKKIFEINNYNKKKHLWNCVDIEGEYLGTERTLNQQIWFSAMALKLGKITNNKNLIENSYDFFDNLPKKIYYLGEKGLINHLIMINKKNYKFKQKIKSLPVIKEKFSTDPQKEKSIGYLSFVLYGLSLAYQSTSSDRLWGNRRLNKIVNNAVNYLEHSYEENKKFVDRFNWQYNPTGIELAFTYYVFGERLKFKNIEESQKKWLNSQFLKNFDFEKGSLSKNTIDKNILSSRLYEATRLPNLKVFIKD